MSHLVPKVPVFLNPKGANPALLQIDASALTLKLKEFRKKQDSLTREVQKTSKDPFIKQNACHGPYYGTIGGGYTYEITFLEAGAVMLELVHLNGNSKIIYGSTQLANTPLKGISGFSIDASEAEQLIKHPFGSTKARWWKIEDALTPKYTYCFTPTGLGGITIVRFNDHKDFELNITDFDSW